MKQTWRSSEPLKACCCTVCTTEAWLGSPSCTVSTSSKMTFEGPEVREATFPTTDYWFLQSVWKDERSLAGIPDVYFANDEILYPVRTRVSYKQYNPSKPAWYGFLFKSVNADNRSLLWQQFILVSLRLELESITSKELNPLSSIWSRSWMMLSILVVDTSLLTDSTPPYPWLSGSRRRG